MFRNKKTEYSCIW